MKTLKKLSLSLLTLGAIGIAGCQDYEPFSLEETRKGAFEKNFLEQYGKYLDPDMNWDLSGLPRTAKYNADDMFGDVFGRDLIPATRGEIGADGHEHINPGMTDYGNYVTKYDGYYQVEQATLDWMNDNLVEQRNNTYQTGPFYMRTPDAASAGRFVIIPIFQGHAVMSWDLHLVTGSKDIKLWTRNEKIQYKETADAEWKDCTDRTDNAYAVRGGAIQVNTSAFPDQNFYFYLDITKGHVKSEYHESWTLDDLVDENDNPKTLAGVPDMINHEDGTFTFWGDYAYTGTKQKSTEGMMVVLPCPTPTNLGNLVPAGKTVQSFLLGVEDADLRSSDWDVNDVVFLVLAGSDDMPYMIESTVHKRYMCEDLGNTYDFDFNDVVVDAWQVEKKVYTSSAGSGQFVSDNQGVKQRIVLKHLGGTNPIQVTVGKHTFHRITDPVNHVWTMKELGTPWDENPDLSGYPASNTNLAGEGWEPDAEEGKYDLLGDDIGAVIEGSIDDIGWDPDRNNITIKAWSHRFNNADYSNDDNSENQTVFTIAFPEHYKTDDPNKYDYVPQIIAVDLSTNWMLEHQQIPEAWWKGGEFGNTPDKDKTYEEIDWNQGHNNLVALGTRQKYTTRGYKMQEDDKHLLADFNNQLITAHSTEMVNDWNHFTVGVYNPDVTLLPGKYDVHFTVVSDKDIWEASVKLGGGNHLGSGEPSEIGGNWNAPGTPDVAAYGEFTFGHRNAGTTAFQAVVTIPENTSLDTQGFTLALLVKRVLEPAELKIAEIWLQRHDDNAIDVNEIPVRRNLFDASTGNVWYSVVGNKAGHVAPTLYSEARGAEGTLKQALVGTDDWQAMTYHFYVPDLDIKSGKYLYSFELDHNGINLTNLSCKMGSGDHMGDTDAGYGGVEQQFTLLEGGSPTKITGVLNWNRDEVGPGMTFSILLKGGTGTGNITLTNLEIRREETAEELNAIPNNLFGLAGAMHYVKRGVRMADAREGNNWVVYTGQPVNAKTAQLWGGWADLPANPDNDTADPPVHDWQNFQVGFFASEPRLFAGHHYRVIFKCNTNDGFRHLRMKFGPGQHIMTGADNFYWPLDGETMVNGQVWGAEAWPYYDAENGNPANYAEEGMNYVSQDFYLPAGYSGAGASLVMVFEGTQKNAQDNYYNKNVFDVTISELRVIDLDEDQTPGATQDVANNNLVLGRRR